MKSSFTKSISFLFVFSFLAIHMTAQQSFFKDVNESDLNFAGQKREIIPSKYRTISFNNNAFSSFMDALPFESETFNRISSPVMEIPMPDGSNQKFHVWQVSIMEPALSAKFPSIKTFRGQGIDDPTASFIFDYTEFGFHGMILSPVSGSVFIDPYSQGTIKNYISYYKKDFFKRMAPEFTPIDYTSRPATIDVVPVGPCRGTQLFTYRLAVACTNEYAIAATGSATPTVAATLAKIVISVNRVTGVYEKEIAVRLLLVANNDQIVFTSTATDNFFNNYTNANSTAGVLINASQTEIDAIIGNGNYDIGHTFSTGAGGLAGLGVVCNPTNKGRGVTGSTSPVGDPYDIDYVAHEMGHEFGGSHTFNSVTYNCGGGNRSTTTAYEVGSGTTIMAYAGICNDGTTNDDIQLHSDPNFHSVSFDQISANLATGTAASCKGVISTGNTLPVITTMDNNGLSIPVSTPFTLSGTATDADGDALSYCWEEWDQTSTGGAWNSGAASTTAPLFKSRIPKTIGKRDFPDMSVIIAGYPAAPTNAMGGLKGETLPTVARTMKFRLTVRDNRAGGGGVVTGGSGCQTGFTTAFQIKTVVPAGPGVWSVLTPNGGENWLGNSTQTVTWNVAGTTASPISCSNVNILMSLDGGLTYYDTVALNTPNDGSEVITVPNIATTTTVRFRVECANNVFFDISNANFTITAAANPKYITKQNGAWSQASTWIGNAVPPITGNCIVRHTVNVISDATCKTLRVEKLPGGFLTVNTTKKLTVTN